MPCGSLLPYCIWRRSEFSRIFRALESWAYGLACISFPVPEPQAAPVARCDHRLCCVIMRRDKESEFLDLEGRYVCCGTLRKGFQACAITAGATGS